jgi:hypothetical protein
MRALIVVMLSLLFVVGCVAPAPSAQAEADVASASEQPATPPRNPVPVAAPDKPRIGQPVKMPPMSDPLPPERVQVSSPAAAQVVRTCKVDSDCMVKDVGNCCGYVPACVNRNSPTDPAAVRAQCAKDGISSVCGFNEITACRCVRNQCIDDREPVGGWMDDPPAPPPAER